MVDWVGGVVWVDSELIPESSQAFYEGSLDLCFEDASDVRGGGVLVGLAGGRLELALLLGRVLEGRHRRIRYRGMGWAKKQEFQQRMS